MSTQQSAQDPDGGWADALAVIWLLGGDPEEARHRAETDLVSKEVVLEGVRRYLQGIGTREERSFTRWDSHPPGTLDLRVFEQSTWWVDVLRRPHRISQMSTRYLRNVLAFIEAEAGHFHGGYARFRPHTCASTPRQCLATTPLMKSLAATLAGRDDASSTPPD